MDEGMSVAQRMDLAATLAQRFARHPDGMSDAELAARAVPPWTKEEVNITGPWLRALQTEPKLWLRARPGQGQALAGKLGECRILGRGALADTLEYRGTQDLFRTPEFHAGEFELQDVTSQAVSLICAPSPGETWWDACAGEGGKTLHLSDLMQNQGLIWATDRAAWRLQKLKRRAARAKVFNYRAALWDEGPKLPMRTRFDGVLLDAPCSGMGTWQRNPHARWTTRLEDVKELAVLQEQLLALAASAVKPGGKLIYSVCTVARSETDHIADRFGERFPDFEPLPMPVPLDPNAPPGVRVMLWPQDFGGNGMFVAGWKRR